ncbi:hypothetical protein [Geoalkalibacter halelectricus]|uniref:hypothetical protein n=1 Tax=Geoalkalibacter halelectricus TaxID=2847045 RepID=UPI00267030EA|nr:hypothetical protein [Geoalkalibacter halelectricus]MDO3380403.1 hypothetical protein [Geoalkalibacter halelectricus]
MDKKRKRQRQQRKLARFFADMAKINYGAFFLGALIGNADALFIFGGLILAILNMMASVLFDRKSQQ